MNLVDIVIIVVLVAGVLTGLRQGLIVEVALIGGAIVALVVAHLEYPVLRAVLEPFFHGLIHPARRRTQWLTIASYGIIFLLVWSIIMAIAQKVRTIVRLLF